MCQTAFFRDPKCGCRWMAIVQPCWPGHGFSTCPHLFNGVAKDAPRCFRATKVCCPVHDLCGVYDRNLIREVIEVRNGIKWGWGPSELDPGVEVQLRCCRVM